MAILSVLWMVFRRIITQWRLEVCLFLGLLVATGVVTAIPLYTGGALQDSFLKQWETAYSSQPPGTYSIDLATSSFTLGSIKAKQFLSSYTYLRDHVSNKLGIPLLASGWSCSLSDAMELPGPDNDPDNTNSATITTMTGLNGLVHILEGRMPSDTVPADGIPEVACALTASDPLGLTVGKVIQMTASTFTEASKMDTIQRPHTKLKFRVVGTFEVRKDRLTSPQWVSAPTFEDTLFVSPKVFLDYLVLKKDILTLDLNYTWVMDHHKVLVSDLERLVSTFNGLDRDFRGITDLLSVSQTPQSVFEDFIQKQGTLRTTMLAISLPTLALILYYIVLAAGLIVDQRRGEIAMLRSRGASTIQLTMSFIIEWSMLGLGCIIAGPPVGLFLAQVMGASAGFLSFVDRRALPIHMTIEAYQYAIILALLMIVAATIPAIQATRYSIVAYKQDRGREGSKPFWQRFYLDILLLGIGLMGYRTLWMSVALRKAATDENPTNVFDPLLFIVPTVIIIAVAMLLLRFLPLLASLAGRFLSRRRGFSLYSSLIEASRNAARFRPLILLVVLTTATGIYGAATARTLDQNAVDRVMYSTGADVVLHESWYRMKPAPNPSGMPMMGPPQMVLDTSRPFEPSFLIHKTLPGIVACARVQTTPNCQVQTSNSGNPVVTTMAIDPVDFGKTAWFRRDLTVGHPFRYLNMLSRYPSGAIVSQNVLDSANLKLGESFTMTLNRQMIDFVIVGAVKYWPTLDSSVTPFVIVNLDYVTACSTIAPYNVWVKLAPGVKITPLVKAGVKKGLPITSVDDTNAEIITARRDPQTMGLYGIISIGFCVAVLITVIGFLLYTFISIRNRLLQFGVLRAVGLSLKQLIAMLSMELLWSLGIALLVGTLAGQAISEIFVPFMRSLSGVTTETPPFRIIISGADIQTIYTVLLPVLLVSLVALSITLARLQVHQAVKLGEDG